MNNTIELRPAFAPDFSSRQASPDDHLSMQAAYRLRYDVYALECGYLPAVNYPDQLETDAFDPLSAHFCAFNRAKELVAYMRLVSPDHKNQLPFEQHGSAWLPGALRPPLAHSGEISRFMVRKDYRRRRGDMLCGVTAPGEGDAAAHERRNPSPQIMLSLFRCLYAHSLAANVNYWFAAMERPLIRALSLMGFVFRPVAEPADYYGEVTPCVADLRELERRVQASNPALLQWLQSADSEAG